MKVKHSSAIAGQRRRLDNRNVEFSPVIHQPPASHEWWRTAVIYQVYPRSFSDSNGDGYGDLPGITSRLDHLVSLGVDALWLSPFYRSPQKDGGYDVSDYRDVDPLFGTLADADALIEAAHTRGLKVIIDLVPNHTSADHPWFAAALASPEGSPERARYIFREGRGVDGSEPPNNWTSIFGKSAWTRLANADGTGGQWYLHLFDSSQPDLDWTNPEVATELESILRFWLDRGVDGFRVDVAHGLVKAPGLPDWVGHVEMVGGTADGAGGQPDGAGGQADSESGTADTDAAPSSAGQAPPVDAPMFDQEGVHEIYRQWRAVLDEYDVPDENGVPGERYSRALVAEAWVQPATRIARYVRADEMQQAFNFEYLDTPWDAQAYREVIERSYTAFDAVGAPTTWVLSNHDVIRHPSRFGYPPGHHRTNGIYPTDPQPDEALGLARGRAATLFTLALPGSMYLYNGEETGLPEHSTLPNEVRQAPEFFRTNGGEAGRDGCRVPLPWEAAAPGFGFSPSGRTWLPQPESWAAYAVDAQRDVPGSTLEMYRSALRLRREHALGEGSLQWVDGLPDGVLAFRVCGAGDPVIVLANLGADPVGLPEGTRVVLASCDLVPGDTLPPNAAMWLA